MNGWQGKITMQNWSFECQYLFLKRSKISLRSNTVKSSETAALKTYNNTENALSSMLDLLSKFGATQGQTYSLSFLPPCPKVEQSLTAPVNY